MKPILCLMHSMKKLITSSLNTCKMLIEVVNECNQRTLQLYSFRSVLAFLLVNFDRYGNFSASTAPKKPHKIHNKIAKSKKIFKTSCVREMTSASTSTPKNTTQQSNNTQRPMENQETNQKWHFSEFPFLGKMAMSTPRTPW